MPARRAARAALLVAAAIGLAGAIALPASCAAVLGVSDDRESAVHKMCQCDQMRFLPACEDTLSSRLANASEATRAAWLAAYAEKCAVCDDALTCFYLAPTCSSSACDEDEECCTHAEGGRCDKDASICTQK